MQTWSLRLHYKWLLVANLLIHGICGVSGLNLFLFMEYIHTWRTGEDDEMNGMQ